MLGIEGKGETRSNRYEIPNLGLMSVNQQKGNVSNNILVKNCKRKQTISLNIVIKFDERSKYLRPRIQSMRTRDKIENS